jgi:hypothetical protein
MKMSPVLTALSIIASEPDLMAPFIQQKGKLLVGRFDPNKVKPKKSKKRKH